MKKCKACQSEIDEKATICLHCRTKQPIKVGKVTTIIATIIIAFILLKLLSSMRSDISSIGSDNLLKSTSITTTNSATPTIAQPSPTATPKVALKLDTMAWVKEYDKNKLVANDKYKGKYVEFSGKIKNISESFGTPYLSLEPPTSDSFYLGTTIKCDFTGKEPLKSLENEKTVALRGTVDEQSFGIIGVRNCEVIQ